MECALVWHPTLLWHHPNPTQISVNFTGRCTVSYSLRGFGTGAGFCVEALFSCASRRNLRQGPGNLHAMAAVACQMTTLRVVQSHKVTLDSQAVRGCRAVTRCAAFGARCGAVSTLGARLHATGAGRWAFRSSGSVRFAVSAVVDEAVSASQADSGAPAESLSMYFKAEGSLNENAVSKVTKVLEGTEGVSQVKVYIDEGAATVELVKQTNIQATGVASSLVELIEQAGFKMQALSLGFDDDDAEDDDYIDYDASTYTEEEEATAE